ncbi:lymphocyte activation gene 3 protein isoform X1 [Chiroxiphia lanceolata]|uniref:lymphocyte activation gene 3 protein isoform X1 n=1 Tax=Chiroxiphia lanceolata TaxID=296741 RepID=UPI0013CEB78E|nr:lymphocyte activation gene 3 protein isoform X1 [Chiroxiphia lanceolata]XP_032534416.1 lymphocyte activation gene 3 protein isoform X1 [Chiroxiphia lanceolata]XP_032534417.1 lymphocyte activation gene 3 protein isoform X1 [Chiroxiphia lanceolata]
MRPMSLVLFLTFVLLAFSAGHILAGLAEGESREQKIWVREGSSAVLPCHLSPRKMRKSLKQLPDKTSVQWKRHGGSVHQESHGVLEVGYSGLQKTALLMKPRVSLQDSALHNGNFSLRIEPVRSEDAGLYEARVQYNSEVHSCHVELGVVTVTLSPPNPVEENELLLMSCNSSYRASLVEICWFHNGHLGPPSRTFCSSPGALSILRPAMSDAGSWRCQLRYSDNEIISATYNLQILGFDGPTNPVVYAAAGSAAHLPCSLSYLPSSFQINTVTAHWSHLAGGHLQDWDIFPNLSNRNFPLHLPAVGPGDAGQYRCAVSVGHKTISREVTLAVVTVTPSIQGPVSEGSRLLLICSLTHSRGHERFQWKHLGSVPTKSKLAVATPQNVESSSAQMGPILKIPKVSQKDTGTWECSVYGPEGQLGGVEYELQITSAQVSSPPAIFSGQVTFGLTLTLFLLLAVCVVALALQKRAQTPAFSALEGMIAVPGPWKSMKENQKGKIQQTEC